MYRQLTSTLARDGKNILCIRCQHPDWVSSASVETGEAAAFAAFASSWRQDCGNNGLGWPISCPAFARALGVGCWGKRYRVTVSGYFTYESTSFEQKR